MNNKKEKYKRMSSEDFKAICAILFESPNPARVKYTGQTFRGIRD